MLRLMIEDVTLAKSQKVSLHVRFRGGATTTLCIEHPLPTWRIIKTDDTVVAEIDELLASHTYSEVAKILNARGRTTGVGARFTRFSVGAVVHQYELKSLKQRLRSLGMLSARELADKLGVAVETIYSWQQRGLIDGIVCNDRRERMYEPNTQPVTPARSRQVTLSKTSAVDTPRDRHQQVQYD